MLLDSDNFWTDMFVTSISEQAEAGYYAPQKKK